MKVIAVVLVCLISLAGTPPAIAAPDIKASQLMEKCASVMDFASESSRENTEQVMRDAVNANYCIGYVRGVIFTLMGSKAVCGDIAPGEVLKSMQSRLYERPYERLMAASNVLILTLMDEYPCEGR